MEPFAGKAKLISPAITNGGAPMGVAWMKDFLQACSGCHIDGIAMHWYDSATNIAYFQNYLTEASRTFGKPIWLTEFAGAGSVSRQQTFLNTVVPWMEQQSLIDRYAAFGAFAGTFINSDGSLTPLGSTYASAL